MSPLLYLLTLGFLLGMRHATDADHVVALTTIVARQQRLWASSLIGALWGAGHTVTILVVGGAIALFKVVISPRVGLGLELAVALMLIALGSVAVARSRAGEGAEPAAGDGEAKASRRACERGAVSLTRMAARPVLVGVVHGLAGSATVTLLVLSAIPGARWALFYLLVFGLGTIAGMMLLTTAIALPFTYTARRFDRVNAWLARATGLASIAFGALIGYQLIAVHGLFSPAPQWPPR